MCYNDIDDAFTEVGYNYVDILEDALSPGRSELAHEKYQAALKALADRLENEA